MSIEIIDNLTQSRKMLKFVQVMPTVPSFLKDTFFPNVEMLTNGDVADLEFRRETRDIVTNLTSAANPYPTVYERQATLLRAYKTPNISIARTLNTNQLFTRLPGEDIYSETTLVEKAQKLIAQDMLVMERTIFRTYEQWASKILTAQDLTLSVNNVNETIPYYVTNVVNNNSVTYWDTGSSPNPINDLVNAFNLVLQTSMRAPTKCIMESTALEAFMANATVEKELFQKQVTVIEGKAMAIEKYEGLSYIGTLVRHNLELYAYTQFAGTGNTALLPAGTVIVGYPDPASGFIYGPVAFEEGGTIVASSAPLVPRSYYDMPSKRRWLEMNSRGLPVLVDPNTICVLNVLS